MKCEKRPARPKRYSEGNEHLFLHFLHLPRQQVQFGPLAPVILGEKAACLRKLSGFAAALKQNYAQFLLHSRDLFAHRRLGYVFFGSGLRKAQIFRDSQKIFDLQIIHRKNPVN